MGMGKTLRELRIKEGLTMKELGLKVGVTEQAISQYERDKREPKDEMLVKILEALNFDMEPYIEKTIEINPIWKNSLSYIEKLIDYCNENEKINLRDLDYLTVHEVINFINKNTSYIEKITKDHLNSTKPKEGIIMLIEEPEEFVIEVNSESDDNNYDTDFAFKNDSSLKESLSILHFKSLMEDLNLNEFKKLSKESLLNIINSKELKETLFKLLEIELVNNKEKKIYEKEEKDHLMPIAAHDKKGEFSEEDYKHDEDIMKNDDLWK